MPSLARSLEQLSPNFLCNFETVSLWSNPQSCQLCHIREVTDGRGDRGSGGGEQQESRYRHVAASERASEQASEEGASEFLFSPQLN